MSHHSEYIRERRRLRKAAGLCRDCPNRVGVFKSLCDACGLLYRGRNRARFGYAPRCAGGKGRPQLIEDEQP